MKKAKKDTEKDLQAPHQAKANTLLKSIAYIQDIEEYFALDLYGPPKEQEKRMLKDREICDKYSLPFPYSLEALQEVIVDGQGFFLKGLEFVDTVQQRPCKPTADHRQCGS